MQVFTSQWVNNSWSVPLNKEINSSNTFILVFGCSKFFDVKEPFDDLIRTFPDSVLVGCSTAGEIYGSEVFDESLSVAIVKFEHTRVKKVSMPIATAVDSHKVGSSLAKELVGDDLVAALVLSDGLCVNGTQLIQGINEVLPKSVVTSGGLAGDGSDFKRTWVLHNNYPRAKVVTLLGLYGSSLSIHTSSVGGWDVFGPERIITRSEANVLYELDHKPALELYKRYLGKKANELPSSALLFPLSLSSDYMGRQGVVRTVLSVDENSQSMTFAGDMPQGSKAQLMRANFDRLIDGASIAATQASFPASNGENPTLSIAISCVGRRLVLGERIEDETEAVLEILPKSTIQVGFYSYGEISSGGLGNCDLHNQTMTLTTIREEV